MFIRYTGIASCRSREVPLSPVYSFEEAIQCYALPTCVFVLRRGLRRQAQTVQIFYVACLAISQTSSHGSKIQKNRVPARIYSSMGCRWALIAAARADAFGQTRELCRIGCGGRYSRAIHRRYIERFLIPERPSHSLSPVSFSSRCPLPKLCSLNFYISLIVLSPHTLCIPMNCIYPGQAATIPDAPLCIPSRHQLSLGS